MTRYTLKHHDVTKELDVTLYAGKILMESGAEIYRIEETIAHIANALGIRKFESYVVNRGIIASGLNKEGQQEAKSITTQQTQINLGKLEAVNQLSRHIVATPNLNIQEIFNELDNIQHRPDEKLLTTFIAYFLGSGAFSLALGSSLEDALASALSGIVLGCVIYLIQHRINTGFLITIIGSIVVTIVSNLLFLIGLGEHQGQMILGTLMLLVPGAFFVNSIREITQNNYATGITLMLDALFTCVSISAGIAAATELLPFAHQLTEFFPGFHINFFNLAVRPLAAGIGTIAFSILYHVPKKYFLDLGILSALSWLLYIIFNDLFHIEAVSIFIPSIVIALFSRILAMKRKSPTTIFLAPSMFPLLPGLSFFRAVYFMLTAENSLAILHLRNSFISAFTIAVAIAIVHQLPLTFNPKSTK